MGTSQTNPDKQYAVGIDVGGTHTDLILSTPEGLVRSKSFTTHENYSDGIFNALSLAADQIDMKAEDLIPRLRSFVNGSTIVTNVITELRGAKVGVLITHGFKDTFRVAGGARRTIYDDHQHTSPPDIVSRDCIEEISERVMSDGSIAVRLDEQQVRDAVARLLDKGVEAIAVCYLWSFREPAQEQRTREIIKELSPNTFVTLSSDISPVIKEYPRFLTAVFNCSSHRATTRYVDQLKTLLDKQKFDGTFTFFQGIGGSIGIEAVKEEPIKLLASGPAGGVMAARYIGKELGLENILVGDMGGTSFDAAVMHGLEPPIAKSVSWDVFRTGVDIIDVVSVGAGGGSIAWIDTRGMPCVGPQSAGSEPGPVCYGRGGQQPTVTDANVILGLIDPDNYLKGKYQIDVEAAREVVGKRIGEPLGWTVEHAAAGIYDLATVNMADALRVITIERGHDPRDFTFFSYGGGLGLFAAEICRRMGIRNIIIPDNCSAFSAYGVLIADYVRQYNRTVQWVLSDKEKLANVNEEFNQLREQAIANAVREGIAEQDLEIRRFAEMQFMGQVFQINVPIPDDDLTIESIDKLDSEFPALYEKNYGEGTAWKGSPVAITTITLKATYNRPKPPSRFQESGATDTVPSPKSHRDVYLPFERSWKTIPIYEESTIHPGNHVDGPCIVDVGDTTIYVPAKAVCKRDNHFNFALSL